MNQNEFKIKIKIKLNKKELADLDKGDSINDGVQFNNVILLINCVETVNRKN